MNRSHCKKKGKNSKNEWDTVKPLRKYFESKRSVTLIDDSKAKVLTNERWQMIWIPEWNGSKDDQVLIRLLYMLVAVRRMELRDLRYMTEYISMTLFRTSNLVLEKKLLSIHAAASSAVGRIVLRKMGFSESFLSDKYRLVTEEKTHEVIIVHKNVSMKVRKEIVNQLR